MKYVRVLVRIGWACFQTLRPLACSLLAEIVHRVQISHCHRYLKLFLNFMQYLNIFIWYSVKCPIPNIIITLRFVDVFLYYIAYWCVLSSWCHPSQIIYLFSSNMNDTSLSLNIHTKCVRLMLNLVQLGFITSKCSICFIPSCLLLININLLC